MKVFNEKFLEIEKKKPSFLAAMEKIIKDSGVKKPDSVVNQEKIEKKTRDQLVLTALTEMKYRASEKISSLAKPMWHSLSNESDFSLTLPYLKEGVLRLKR